MNAPNSMNDPNQGSGPVATNQQDFALADQQKLTFPPQLKNELSSPGTHSTAIQKFYPSGGNALHQLFNAELEKLLPAQSNPIDLLCFSVDLLIWPDRETRLPRNLVMRELESLFRNYSMTIMHFLLLERQGEPDGYSGQQQVLNARRRVTTTLRKKIKEWGLAIEIPEIDRDSSCPLKAAIDFSKVQADVLWSQVFAAKSAARLAASDVEGPSTSPNSR